LLVKETLPSLGPDVVMVSLDGDPNEDAALLKRYTEQHGFTWRFAVAPRELMSSLASAFGNEYLNPPSDPMFVVAPSGAAFRLPSGHKSAADLRAFVEQYRSR
jgi:hypothetical protein